MNDHSLAVYGVVMFALKKFNEKLMVPYFNVFKEFRMKLGKEIDNKDVAAVR